MKLKHQITALVVLIALAGCNRSEPKSNEPQPPVTPATNSVIQGIEKGAVQVAPGKDAGPVTMPATEGSLSPPPSPPALPTPAAPAPADSLAAESKEQFIAAVEQRLKDADAKIMELAQKAQSLKDDAKVQADQALAALGQERDKVNAKFEELKKSSAEAWKEVKAGFASAMDDMEKAYENAKSKFN